VVLACLYFFLFLTKTFEVTNCKLHRDFVKRPRDLIGNNKESNLRAVEVLVSSFS
jgi:hypothetical protein